MRSTIEYLENSAAVYKFINDQTLTYLNQGYTSDEISNMIELPEALEKNWYTRQYYGTVAHNSKAVYQKYMGWYDANPVNLNPLTPTESAKKWVEYLGDTDQVLRHGESRLRQGRIPVGGGDHQCDRIRRSCQRGRTTAVRRRAGTAGLSGGIRARGATPT